MLKQGITSTTRIPRVPSLGMMKFPNAMPSSHQRKGLGFGLRRAQATSTYVTVRYGHVLV
jgi:hypothetical protein